MEMKDLTQEYIIMSTNHCNFEEINFVIFQTRDKILHAECMAHHPGNHAHIHQIKH